MSSSVYPKLSEISLFGVPPSSGPIDGYSYCGLKIVSTLKNMGISVPWRDDGSPVSISFCQPEWYAQNTKQYRIGYTPWESTEMPEWWANHMNQMDEMWTTSDFCAEVFESYGVKNVKVVPHGIDSNEWSISRREFSDKKFTFFHMGEPATRKNGQMAFDAFNEVFGNNPNVYFYMKANGWTEARMRSPWGPITQHPRVTLVTEKLPLAALSGIFGTMHCLIYPSNGEGFGMIPFQTIASGMPTLLVNWGGIQEFGDYGIPIEYKVSGSGHNYHTGEWAFPDFDDLCAKMAYVYENYDKVADESYSNGLSLRKRFAWEAILSEAIAGIRL